MGEPLASCHLLTAEQEIRWHPLTTSWPRDWKVLIQIYRGSWHTQINQLTAFDSSHLIDWPLRHTKKTTFLDPSFELNAWSGQINPSACYSFVCVIRGMRIFSPVVFNGTFNRQPGLICYPKSIQDLEKRDSGRWDAGLRTNDANQRVTSSHYDVLQL